jgi:iron uptake system component EfeO
MADLRSFLRRTAGLVAGGAVALSMAACSSSDGDSGGTNANSAKGAAPADQRDVVITITADSCPAEYTSYNSGALTFKITNKDATAVSEIEVMSEGRILGEKENMPAGFSGSFALKLEPGDYTLYCPGAKTEKSPLRITGEASSTPNTDTHALLVAGATQYQDYVAAQVGMLVDAVAALQTAIGSGDVDAAKKAYVQARPFYERIEPVAESFPDLDPAIDAREGDVPADEWTGFHPIEKQLFTKNSTDGLTDLAAGLVTNVGKLKTLVDALPGFQPAELANGAVGLLDEAAKSKITGEEERYSRVDLMDFVANIEGAQQAFLYLQDGLAKIDPALMDTIKTAFDQVTTLVDQYKDPSSLSGYRPYDRLTNDDTRRIAQALQAVAEPLSRVAGKVVDA